MKSKILHKTALHFFHSYQQLYLQLFYDLKIDIHNTLCNSFIALQNVVIETSCILAFHQDLLEGMINYKKV